LPNDSNFRVGREYRTEVRQKWESASGGMVSTMADFSRFAQMLVQWRYVRGQDLSRPKTFELMTSTISARTLALNGIILFSRRRLWHGSWLAVRTDPAMQTTAARDRWAN
jgi:hypothetical protein